MLLLRLVGILALVSIGLCFVLYAVSRDQRYLRFAWRVFLGTLAFAVLLMLIYAAERFMMTI
jgi:hypothetical protein